MKVVWIVVLVVLIGCHFQEKNSEFIPPKFHFVKSDVAVDTVPIVEKVIIPSLQSIMDNENYKTSDVSVKIDKSDFKLYFQVKDSTIKSFPVVFGGNQTDDKLRQGDHCTPEGKFKMRSKYPHSDWNKFIWVDYPNQDSWRKHNEAKANGTIPQTSKIGGEIGIHGVPGSLNNWMINDTVNWTLGCISLRNDDLNEIYPYFHKSIWIKIQK